MCVCVFLILRSLLGLYPYILGVLYALLEYLMVYYHYGLFSESLLLSFLGYYNYISLYDFLLYDPGLTVELLAGLFLIYFLESEYVNPYGPFIGLLIGSFRMS